MKIRRTNAWLGMPGIIGLVAIITLAAFTGHPQQHHDRAIANLSKDTTPDRKRNRVTRQLGDRDLDKELRELDNAKETLEDVDWDKIKRDIENAMKGIDLEKIRLQAQQTLLKTDMQKMQRQIEESLRSIDFDKMKIEIEASIEKVNTEIDKEKIWRELENAKKQVQDELHKKDWKKEMEQMQKFNKEELEKELRKAKVEMDRVKDEIKFEKLDLKREMEKAHVEIDKAKEELKEYQEMIYSMEKDGLLDTKEDYTIEYKNGDLLINDKKQPKEITGKYRKYFKKDKVKLKKKDGEFNFNHGSSDIHID